MWNEYFPHLNSYRCLRLVRLVGLVNIQKYIFSANLSNREVLVNGSKLFGSVSKYFSLKWTSLSVHSINQTLRPCIHETMSIILVVTFEEWSLRMNVKQSFRISFITWNNWVIGAKMTYRRNQCQFGKVKWSFHADSFYR